MDKVEKILTKNGINVKIGKGKGQLNDGQVFGCEFYPASELKKEVDAYVFLGQSNFHAAGIALSTNLPTFVLDPYFNEVREVTEFARNIKKESNTCNIQSSRSKFIWNNYWIKRRAIIKSIWIKI